MVLLVLAIMDARILGFIKNWTLKIFRILSEDPAEQEGTWNEFSRAPECVCSAQSLAQMVAVVSQIIHQAEFGNHDQEVNHARMRHRLDVAQGSTFGFANAALAHMGQEVGIRHYAFKRKGEKKRRGRRQVQKRRTKCFHAWNAYVEIQPVRTIKKLKGKEIKSGAHLRGLGRRWKCMSPQEQQILTISREVGKLRFNQKSRSRHRSMSMDNRSRCLIGTSALRLMFSSQTWWIRRSTRNLSRVT